MNKNEILSHFDSLFGTRVKKHIELNMPLIKCVLDRLCELPSMPSRTYRKALHQQNVLADKLRATMTEEQREMFEAYQEMKNQTLAISDEQLFCFGYIFAKEFDIEGKIDKE